MRRAETGRSATENRLLTCKDTIKTPNEMRVGNNHET